MNNAIKYAKHQYLVSSPNNEEGIAVNVIRLDGVLPILEHNLDKLPEVSSHHRGLKVCIYPIGTGRHASKSEDSRNLEVVCKF